MEWMHPLEVNLAAVVDVLKLILEAVSVLCVAAGLVVTVGLVMERYGCCF